MSVLLPAEMLHAANSTLRARRERRREVSLRIVESTPQARGIAGQRLQPVEPLDEAPTDLVIVPSMWGNPRPVLSRSRDLVAWLGRRAQAGARLVGAGSGAFLLAETGLLDGGSATTHWSHFETFARRYPSVTLRRSYFIVESGSFYTVGSINALADLIVHLLRSEVDEEAARVVERHFSHEARRPYEGSFFSDHRPVNVPDELVADVQEHLTHHRIRDLRLADVAAQFGVSVRTLTRRFRAATGTTLRGWVEQRRIQDAQELLRDSNLEVAGIARRCGYSDPRYFSRVFRRVVGVGPREYRDLVRAKLFSNPA